jgi:hypothetical protein
VRQITDAAYGEQATFRADQQGAPMAASANQAEPMQGVDPAAGVTPLGAPSERPDEPVTAGADVGPGPGSDILGLPSGRGEAKNLQKFLPAIERVANQPESSQTLRNLVQFLKGL